jgi:hypothetical protein
MLMVSDVSSFDPGLGQESRVLSSSVLLNQHCFWHGNLTSRWVMMACCFINIASSSFGLHARTRASRMKPSSSSFSIFMCMLRAASFLAFENSRPQIALLI